MLLLQRKRGFLSQGSTPVSSSMQGITVSPIPLPQKKTKTEAEEAARRAMESARRHRNVASEEEGAKVWELEAELEGLRAQAEEVIDEVREDFQDELEAMLEEQQSCYDAAAEERETLMQLQIERVRVEERLRAEEANQALVVVQFS